MDNEYTPRDLDRGPEAHRPWRPMELVFVGRVDEVLRQGEGKITVPAGDPGEPRKQTPIA
jgi:hypothetical protein